MACGRVRGNRGLAVRCTMRNEKAAPRGRCAQLCLLPSPAVRCLDGVESGQTAWCSPLLTSSAIEAEGEGAVLREETDEMFLGFSFFRPPSTPFQKAQCSAAIIDGKRDTSFSGFHLIDCLAKAMHLLTAFNFFLSVGQLSCPLWRSPFCQPALVHPCPVHTNQTIPQRQDKEKGNHEGLGEVGAGDMK